jgi:basic amino acid/polyamine antiporter, APA family
MMLAMGRRQDLFPLLERVHSKYQVPHLGILLTGLIIVALCLFGTFEFILASAAFTILLYYSITNIAAYVQPKHERRFGFVVPILGLVGCLLMALSLDSEVILSGIILLLLGFITRFVVKRFI